MYPRRPSPPIRRPPRHRNLLAGGSSLVLVALPVTPGHLDLIVVDNGIDSRPSRRGAIVTLSSRALQLSSQYRALRTASGVPSTRPRLQHLGLGMPHGGGALPRRPRVANLSLAVAGRLMERTVLPSLNPPGDCIWRMACSAIYSTIRESASTFNIQRLPRRLREGQPSAERAHLAFLPINQTPASQLPTRSSIMERQRLCRTARSPKEQRQATPYVALISNSRPRRPTARSVQPSPLSEDSSMRLFHSR